MPAKTTLARSHSLRIAQSGICCAVGLNIAAACCAMRAGMDHFQESAFRDESGKPLRVASLPLGDLWGQERISLMSAAAVRDCIAHANLAHSRGIAVVMLVAEPERPHSEAHRFEACRSAVEEALAGLPVMAVGLVAEGRAGVGRGLETAQQLLNDEQIQHVLLVGVDSYLNAATINHFLASRRMLSTDNPSGFVPGEGAGAVLLDAPGRTDPVVRAGDILVSGIGCGFEEARPDGQIANRAIALTAAIRAALRQADLSAGALQFRMSDQNGDPFLAREAALAYARITAAESVALPLFAPAENVGEIGAATGVIALAYSAICCAAIRRQAV